jgi:hypothetical protein
MSAFIVPDEAAWLLAGSQYKVTVLTSFLLLASCFMWLCCSNQPNKR